MRSQPRAARRAWLAVVGLLVILAPSSTLAQQASELPASATPAAGRSEPAAAGSSGQNSPSVAEQHRLPPDATTKQTVTLPDRTLSFTATAGSIRLFNDKGESEADIAYTAYQLDGGDPATRPVTFFFNGGPGAASAWLQLGAAGPWRIAFGSDGVSPSPEPKANAETWLDFSDLVFIDPVEPATVVSSRPQRTCARSTSLPKETSRRTRSRSGAGSRRTAV